MQNQGPGRRGRRFHLWRALSTGHRTYDACSAVRGAGRTPHRHFQPQKNRFSHGAKRSAEPPASLRRGAQMPPFGRTHSSLSGSELNPERGHMSGSLAAGERRQVCAHSGAERFADCRTSVAVVPQDLGVLPRVGVDGDLQRHDGEPTSRLWRSAAGRRRRRGQGAGRSASGISRPGSSRRSSHGRSSAGR